MKKFISILLFVYTSMLFAESIDITVSQGTDQSVIDTLSPAPASPEVDTNTTIKVTFNEALNPIFALKSVSLKKLTKDNNNKGFFGIFQQNNQNSIKGTTRYNSSTYTISFTPDKPLEVGFYEVKFSHLITQMPNIHMRINDIVYRFYVPKVINGFKLPPKPDKDKNDKTLLGIDFNYNGIRDDVERWAIMYYQDKSPLYTSIAFQASRGYQLILKKQPKTKEEAKKVHNEVRKALQCESYFRVCMKQPLIIDPIVTNHTLNNILFNTDRRKKTYIKYDILLSGDSYTIPWCNERKNKCNFNVNKYDEE